MTVPPTAPPPTAPAGPFPAFVVERAGSDVIKGLRSLTADDLGEGDVLVRVDWSAVNFKDGMVARAGNRVARISPLVPGVDLVGTVVESEIYPPGQQVIVHGYDLGVSHHGGFAAYARVPAGWVVPLPPALTARRAAIIGTAGFTAALSLRQLEQRGLVPEAGPVLVTGASGGVGSMAVALLAARGYQVTASTGKATEHAYLTDLGATEVIGRQGLAVEPGRTLGPPRWAGAIDCVGGPTLNTVLQSLAYGAAVAASGLTGGSSLECTVYPFIVRNVALLGVDSVQTPIADRRSTWDELASSYADATLDEMVDREVELHQVGSALSTIADGGVRGRILVRPKS